MWIALALYFAANFGMTLYLISEREPWRVCLGAFFFGVPIILFFYLVMLFGGWWSR